MNNSLQGKKFAILLHEHGEYLSPLLSHLVGVWEELGVSINLLRGTNETPPNVDLLIPHIDLTVTPANLIQYMNGFPRVINRRLTDISKTLVSSNLVSKNSTYDGKVIVKTNMNFGGVPEHNYEIAKGNFPVDPRDIQRPWRKIETLSPENYQVFDRISLVPNGVWRNKRLVVEKFIPEREGEYYCMRVCQTMGNVSMCKRLYSNSPIIKGSTIVRSEAVETPESIMDIKSKFGMDYGKLDFVIHNGHIEVLDINKTPGSPPAKDFRPEWVRQLAMGVEAFL